MALSYRKPDFASKDSVATSLRLSKKRLRELRQKALREGKSMAELVRLAVDEFLGYGKSKVRDGKTLKDDPFFETIGIVKDNIHDGSVNHDKVIYDETHEFRKRRK